MKKTIAITALCLFGIMCQDPSGEEGCMPLTDADTDVELVYPVAGTFEVGEYVEVAWKMNPGNVSQVAVQLSTTGVNGPWRQVFSQGVSTDEFESEVVCLDTTWVVGDEYENIDYSSTETVLLRVTNYNSQGTAYQTDMSNTLTINP